ncbi:MAG: alpha-amylase family glycosyl hydrolase [Lachnospiraceae bacterium]
MKKRFAALLTIVLCCQTLWGCAKTTSVQQNESVTVAEPETVTEVETETGNGVSATDLMEEINGSLTPVKTEDAYHNYYEIFVYSFYDSDGDGIGDINGITQNLDYLNDKDDTTDDDLGVDGIWLMPIMPSSSYHKYDVDNYYEIDEQYGTLEDFQNLLAECDKRGIKVIIDLVMNHSSSQNEWFLEACKYLQSLPKGGEPNEDECPYVSYYHFTKEAANKYHPVPQSEWYYEGQFQDGMPDLNLKSEKVMDEFEKITDYWLDMGVAGFRLDAVGEYETGSTEQSIAELTEFVERVKEKHPDCYLVGEVWQDMTTYTKFYQSGIDSCFDFAFADSTGVIANTVKKANGYQASSFGKAQVNIQNAILENGENGVDAPFYTNHDMARGAGYYSGENSMAQTKIAQAMNLFMSGNAFLYYGEELGMKGSGKDENKRAPMYWSENKTDTGICVGPPNMDSVKMKYGSLAAQKEDGDSIYQYIKQVYKLKSAYPQIARGTVTFEEAYSGENICVVRKTYRDSEILIVYNISAEEQSVDLTGLSLEEGTKPEIGGILLTGTESTSLTEEILTMPPYSVVILK